MPRICRLVTFFLALGLLSTELVAAASSPVAPSLSLAWAHEESDLKPDPNVTWGRLENGLRYAILPHATPHQRAGVCLVVLAGSYHEKEGEQGYAHFVEHMAFRDIRGYPGDSAIRTLQSLGLTFGPHVNAQTGFFKTHYAFGNIPSDEPGALLTSLKILRAMADGVMFEPGAVKRERDVIFGERRLRGDMSARLWSDELEYVAPRREKLRQQEFAAAFDRDRWPDRHPIGLTKTLEGARPKKLRAFYDRWYRPDRMIVTVAGDIAPDRVEQWVRETFASMAARGAAPEENPLDYGTTRPNGADPAVAIQGNAAQPMVEISLGAATRQTAADTLARRRDQLARRVALQLLTARLVRAAEGGGESPFTAASAALAHSVPGHEIAVARVACPPTLWRQALSSLDLELRRACRDGFSELEFERTRQWKSRHVAAEVQQLRTENSLNLARALGFSIADRVVFTSAESDDAWVQSQLPKLTSEQCRDALRALFPSERIFICLFGGFGDDVPLTRLVRTRLRESRTVEPEPYGEIAAAKRFPYTDFGPPSAPVKNEHNSALGADLIQFANGIRLNLRRTDFEPGRVHFMVRFGGGRMACPPDKPGLDTRVIAWALGGVQGLSAEEERAALAELTGWTNTVTATAETFTWAGAGASSQFSQILEATFAHFMYPSFRDEDWTRSLEHARRQLSPSVTTAGGTARRVMIDRLSGHHPAWRFPQFEDVSQRTLAEFKTWIPSQLRDAAMEITLVGDLDPAKAIEAVSRTFGTLPKAAGGDSYADRRQVSYPAKPFSEQVVFDGQNSVAAVVLAWPAPEARTSIERLRGVVLATILNDRLRLKLRSEMGEAYAPSALFIWNDAFAPSPTHMLCEVDCAPTHAERVSAAVRAIVATLAQDGVTLEEFERARSPHVRAAEARLRSNRSWLTVLATSQSQPDEAESWLRAGETYQTMTASEVSQMARKLFSADRQCQVLAVPIGREAELMNVQGMRAYGRKNYRQAIGFFNRAIARSPVYANAYYNRGKSKEALGSIAAARDDYDRALGLSQNEPRAYFQRGLLKRNQGDLTGALLDLERWVGLNPTDADGIAERGATKVKMGDHAGGLLDYNRAVALNPNAPHFLRQRTAAEAATGDKSGSAAHHKAREAVD